MIETWQDIDPRGYLSVTFVRALYDVRSNVDNRYRCNRYIFSARYLGVEFRRAIETKQGVSYDDLKVPGLKSANGVYDVTRGDFDAWYKTFKGVINE